MILIGGNLKTLRKKQKKSQEEVANELGLTRSTYSGYENGVAQPNLDALISFSSYFGISIDALLKENLEVFSESEWQKMNASQLGDVKGSQLRVLTSVVSESNEELIEMIPMKASAGYTTNYGDPDYIKVLPTFTLPFLSKNNKYRSFPIQGDSMPPVVEGSQVVAEYVQNWLSIRNGTPCIVVTKEEGIVFKILYNYVDTNQSFQLCSTNTFYEPYMVHLKDILEIWKFVNYISPELPSVQWDNQEVVSTLRALQKEVFDLRETIAKS